MMRIVSKLSLVGLSVMGLLAQVGCGSHQDELQSWMDAERGQHPPRIQPIQAPQQFQPEAYVSSTGVDPFDEQKLTVVLKKESAQPNSMVAAELNRRKEPLEAYPLDNMKMVGSVSRKGTLFGLLKVDSLLYQVKVGDYVGQNYGKIMKITETDITIREIVQDTVGEWIDRPATLQLQEEAQ